MTPAASQRHPSPETATQSVGMANTLLSNDPFGRLHGDGSQSMATDGTVPVSLGSPGVATGYGGARAAAASNGASRTTVLPVVELRDGLPTLVASDRVRYEPVAQLGQGGMGEVLKVSDNDIQRTVALKRLLPGLDDAGALVRFSEEVRIVGQLEHPNIVPVHDVGIDADGQYFFVMKYVEGETLESIIDKLAAGDAEAHRRFSHEQRVVLFLGILEAVHYAHERGIIHRDIKPANVMVGPYGEVMVMDWGIAKRVRAVGNAEADAAVPTARSGSGAGSPETSPEDAGADRRGPSVRSARPAPEASFATVAGTLVGTPAYMSPEQASGLEADERSDVYSLCVLFHELLAHRHYLADKDSVTEVLHGVLSYVPPLVLMAPSPHQPPPPADLAHFVRKGMSKDPADRFQSVGEMIERLRARQEGKVAIECPITFARSTSQGITRAIDRHPYAVLVAMTSAALGAIAGIAYGIASLIPG